MGADRRSAWPITRLASAAYGRPDGSARARRHRRRRRRLAPGGLGAARRRLAEPAVLDGVRGTVTAVAADDAVRPVLLLATPDGPAVASGTDGGWSTVLLPGGGEAAGIGVERVGDGRSPARRSGGRSTAPDRSRRRRPRRCSAPCSASPGGFVAASCATGGPRPVTRRRVWTDLAAVHPRGVAPVAGRWVRHARARRGGWRLAGVGGR